MWLFIHSLQWPSEGNLTQSVIADDYPQVIGSPTSGIAFKDASA